MEADLGLKVEIQQVSVGAWELRTEELSNSTAHVSNPSFSKDAQHLEFSGYQIETNHY